MQSLDIHLLGPVRVDRAGLPVPVRGRLPLGILALLANSASQVVAVEHLIQQLWGEAPPPAARTRRRA
ncbi:hypothetical protein BH23ACT9_BH23ACT9_07170 [soil metagenome]